MNIPNSIIARLLGWNLKDSTDTAGNAGPEYWQDPEGGRHWEDEPFKQVPMDDSDIETLCKLLSP